MWKPLALLTCTGLLMLGCATRPNHHDPTFITSGIWIQTCLDQMGYNPGRTDGQMDVRVGEAIQRYHADYVKEEITGMGRDPSNKEVRMDANKLFYAECAKILGPREAFVPPEKP
jgi:hypothetical protein